MRKKGDEDFNLTHFSFSSVAQSCLTLCDPVHCSTPGFPVHHQLLEFTQTHVHWVSDAIQPSHPLSSPSPPAFNLSQHQGLSLYSWKIVVWSGGNFDWSGPSEYLLRQFGLWNSTYEKSEKIAMKGNTQAISWFSWWSSPLLWSPPTCLLQSSLWCDAGLGEGRGWD